MNSFDIAVAIGLLVAVGTGFSTGLIRSAVTIMAYLLAMPIAVWVMSYVPPLDGGSGSPLGSNWGFLVAAFILIGMVLGKLGRITVDEAVGPDPGLADRLCGAALGVFARCPGGDFGGACLRPAHSHRPRAGV